MLCNSYFPEAIISPWEDCPPWPAVTRSTRAKLKNRQNDQQSGWFVQRYVQKVQIWGRPFPVKELLQDNVGKPRLQISSQQGSQCQKIQKKFGSPPLTVLISDLSLGTGWPFHGTTGQIGIQLLRIIRVQHITISHVSQSLAYDIWTAPQKFELWGVDHNSHEFQGTLLLYGT